MSISGIATRVARLEQSAGGGGPCPRHDITIGTRHLEDGMTTATREPAQRACRWCGQPAVKFWIVLEIVPSRRREELQGAT